MVYFNKGVQHWRATYVSNDLCSCHLCVQGLAGAPYMCGQGLFVLNTEAGEKLLSKEKWFILSIHTPSLSRSCRSELFHPVIYIILTIGQALC